MSTATSVPESPPQPTAPAVTGDHAVLHGVSWDAYVRLRDEPENDRYRMTYDRGVLELMTVSFFHEAMAEFLARLIGTWTEEHDISIRSCGHMTCQRKDLERALEPDKGYYIAHSGDVRGLRKVKLPDDPPPDLVVEVDVTNPSVNKLPIYAAMGVSEVWRWCKGRVQVLHLVDESFVVHDDSRCLPGFPIDQATQFLVRSESEDETALIRDFRRSVRNE